MKIIKQRTKAGASRMRGANGLSQLIQDYVVRLPKRGGRGVLVGEHILTAAHCIDFTTDGSMTLAGEYCVVEIETHQGRRKVRPLFVDPISDIAFLGALDDQGFPDEAAKFEKVCRTLDPVHFAKAPIKPGRPFEVRLLNADGSWVTGTAEKFDEADPLLWVTAERQVEGGASGGPVLNAAGELVSVVSIASSTVEGKFECPCPHPRWALPAWLVKKLYKL